MNETRLVNNKTTIFYIKYNETIPFKKPDDQISVQTGELGNF